MSIFEESISSLIISGKIGVIPTDTLYGVVAAALNKEAVTKLYKLKSREQKPGTVIAANIKQLVELGLKKRYLMAVEQYWPGAVSVVIPTHDLEYLHQGKFSLAVRVPDDKELTQLLLKTGPLLTSSANMPGKNPAKNIKEAKEIFKGSVDFYVDGGEMSGEPSTVIRVVDDTVEILRQGKVAINESGEVKK